MRVAFVSRSTLFSVPGGDTIQMEKTARALRQLGVRVDFRLGHEAIDYHHYDLLHFFNITRPADLLRHAQNSPVPFVLSTILVDFSEYDRKYRGGLASLIAKVGGQHRLEYAKVMARRFKNGERITSKGYVWRGQRNSARAILRRAAFLLPNSESEYQRAVTTYGVEKPHRVIPNAIETAVFQQAEVPGQQDRQGVLAVGRIEPYKNQLSLIRALKGTEIPLTVIGKPGPNHGAYAEQCRREAGPQVQFLGHLPQEELVRHYTSARVHAMPSWFETTGLTNLEAGALGCNLVMTRRGDTTEYFQEEVTYCEPDSESSIREAVAAAYQQAAPSALRERILRDYTWEKAASETLKAYEQVLKGKVKP